MAIKNSKLATRLKNKTWTNLQIENHKMKHGQTTDAAQKSRTGVLKMLKITDPFCGENYESSSWVKVSL